MTDRLDRWADPPLLVLASLAGGARHGYAIMQDVADTMGVRLTAGTLYAVIARLESRGLIEAVDSEDRRRPYRLTAAGPARWPSSPSGCARSPSSPGNGWAFATAGPSHERGARPVGRADAAGRIVVGREAGPGGAGPVPGRVAGPLRR